MFVRLQSMFLLCSAEEGCVPGSTVPCGRRSEGLPRRLQVSDSVTSFSAIFTVLWSLLLLHLLLSPLLLSGWLVRARVGMLPLNSLPRLSTSAFSTAAAPFVVWECGSMVFQTSVANQSFLCAAGPLIVSFFLSPQSSFVPKKFHALQ